MGGDVESGSAAPSSSKVVTELRDSGVYQGLGQGVRRLSGSL